MGKIQKRKDPRKKKKQLDASQAGAGTAGQNNGSATAKTGFGASLSSIARKKPVATPQRGAKKEAATGLNKIIADSVQFLREVRVELKKVAWPSRKQTIGSTAVVLVLVIIVSLFLGAVDFGLSGIIKMVLG